MAQVQCHELGAFRLECGVTLPAARLVYTTHGTLSLARDNAVLFPTWFGCNHDFNEWIIGPKWGLDPHRHFIIVVNILGNGHSSSPSNSPAPHDGPRFPAVSVLDNVRLQRHMLRAVFGIDRLRLVVGRSMGAQIAYQWACHYPAAVERLLALAGSARTSDHNWLFLEQVRNALTSDPEWLSGEYAQPLTLGLQRMRMLFDGWGVGQGYFRRGLYKAQGYASAQAFATRSMGEMRVDANDILAQIGTWQTADASANPKFGGDLSAALGAITARTIVMPCATDLYFPPEDSAIEVAMMRDAQLRVIQSDWGHRAGSPGSDPVDIAMVDGAIRDLLAR
ncbi:alpha/beta fold hydrolase [Sphingobium sp. H39-3-25]|uniref:alpha/beta fold hydrolase n=1 Tax=Sphingobium arseniciresistens TaxID=3030834 RepID=UPI0023BA055C|nr:alpha/beta fold hydrolase [Sphingobium arseniciresistens]